MAKFKENANMFNIARMEALIIHGYTRIDLRDNCKIYKIINRRMMENGFI